MKNTLQNLPQTGWRMPPTRPGGNRLSAKQKSFDTIIEEIKQRGKNDINTTR